MQVEIKVNGAVVRLIKRSLEINSTLGKRISTVKFDYLGEEKLVPEDKYGLGYALDFDPTIPSYVEIPAAHAQLNFTAGDFSIVARGYIDDLTAHRMLFCRGLTAVDGYFFIAESTGRLRLYVSQTPAAVQSAYADAGTITTGSWLTMGCSRDGAAGKIYRNGIDVTLTSEALVDPTTCARSAKIGIFDDKTSYPFDGKIEFLAVYDCALSEAQHLQIHNDNRPILDGHTVAMWLMDEGVGKYIYDETANNITGKIYSAGWVEGNIPRIIASAPSVATMDANAYGGLTYPWGKDEIKITGIDTDYLTDFFGGYVSTKEMRMVGSRRIYRITAQDYNILPTGQLVTKDFADQDEQQMIDFLFSAYLSEIDTTTYVSSSGVQATLGWTRIPLNEVLDEIAKIYGREWYIDFNKKLHYFTPSIVGAPFELSSSPTPPAKVGYDNIQFGEDTSQVCNRVRVIGTGVNRESISAPSIAYYGREFYCKVVDENIDTNDWGDSVGEAVLAERAFGKETGSLVCYQEGLVVGQKVKIYNFLRGIDDYYLIQGIKFNMLNKTTEKITVHFGAYSKDLITLLGQIKGLEEKE